jgi:transcriptional regulator with XRE-family HTH domain
MISGDKIKRIRMARGLTQQQISDAVQCPKEYISKIENFKMYPSEELYEKIIKAIYSLPDRSKEPPRKGKNRKEE